MNRQNSPIKEPQIGAQASQPKLPLRVSVPTAEFCWAMRITPVSLGLQDRFGVQGGGVGGFATAPGRQRFLIPPERRQAFPVSEFT